MEAQRPSLVLVPSSDGDPRGREKFLENFVKNIKNNS